VLAALLFGVLLALIADWDLGSQFLAGYMVEKSLSVDNLFVIIVTTFAVPAEVQPRALTLEIALALALRGVFHRRPGSTA
jgi:tellurite resistance protein TerC